MGRWKQALRQAVQNNFTLQCVEFNGRRDDDATMEFCLTRNTRLAGWVENPATVPKHLWKEATTLATKAGPETLYRLLRKIGPEILPVRCPKKSVTYECADDNDTTIRQFESR